MGQQIDPNTIANRFRQEIRQDVQSIGKNLNLVGFLCSKEGPSRTYAEYTNKGCQDVGIHFDLRSVERVDLESAIQDANSDANVHGMIIYYPVFGTEHDNYIKDLVHCSKDIEGLSSYWIRKLYENNRVDSHGKKSILPCTPLAIVKILEDCGAYSSDALPLRDKTITIFNRSEVVGRPLASMLTHDGAKVYSFDINSTLELHNGRISESDVSRSTALATSDIVITGVPTKDFDLIKADEISPQTICLNFSTFKNFSTEAQEKPHLFVPRLGPLTVTMALRNTLRLYHDHHKGPNT